MVSFLEHHMDLLPGPGIDDGRLGAMRLQVVDLSDVSGLILSDVSGLM